MVKKHISNSMKELKKLNKYFIKYKYRFILGIIITIASQIFSVFTPAFVGNIISALYDFYKATVSADLVKELIIKNVLLILATTLIAGFLTFLMRQTLIVMSRHIEFDLKNEVYKQYQNLSQNFYKKNKTGDLMSRISEDVGKVRQYVGPAVMYSVNTAIRMTVVIVQMYITSPELTFYALLPVPVLAYIMMRLSKEINNRSFQYQQNLSRLSSFSQEIFSGVRVIKAYALENEKDKEYEKITTESKNIFMRLASANAMIGPLMVLIIGVSNLLVIYIGAKLFINGTITELGVIAQFILYINMLTWPIASLGWVSTMIQEADSSQRRINEFLDEKPEIKNENPLATPIEGKIEFRNVDFVYEDTNIQALKNISFTLETGKTLAILGKTGSGKSTILNLIARLYDTTSGQVLIDDKNIKDLNLNNLRNETAMVPQDAFLFSDSIKNNIKFGNENATDDEVIFFAKMADVQKNIEKFEKQHDTVLGERGLTLSGGQKQRVSIARALIKKPNILLLDDCLSAVDTETEEKILYNLETLTKNKTTIIVTHRVSSAKNADVILILEDGKIIEQGSHSELIDQKGYYQDLYSKQLSEKDIV